MMPTTTTEYRQLLTDCDLCLTGQVRDVQLSAILVVKVVF